MDGSGKNGDGGHTKLMAAWILEARDAEYPDLAAKVFEDCVLMVGNVDGPHAEERRKAHREYLIDAMLKFAKSSACQSVHLEMIAIGGVVYQSVGAKAEEEILLSVLPVAMDAAASHFVEGVNVFDRDTMQRCSEAESKQEIKALADILSTMGVRCHGWLLGKIREGKKHFHPDGNPSAKVH